MKKALTTHHCPACSAALVSQPIGSPLRCKHCGWHLITLKEWQALPPMRQGFMLYMQGAWEGSAIAKAKNPYKTGTPAWTAFCEGERRATLAAQDSEE